MMECTDTTYLVHLIRTPTTSNSLLLLHYLCVEGSSSNLQSYFSCIRITANIDCCYALITVKQEKKKYWS